MAAMTPQQSVRAVYKSEQEVNSTQNTNNSASTVKGDNGFCILASVYNSSSDQYIQNFMAITFDSAPEVGVTRSADITSFPVESGSTVSDNVKINNNTFKLTGVITETPVRLMRDQLYSAGVNGTRISQAIEYLDQIFDARQPIVLLTEHRTFENVILKGYTYEYRSEFAMQFNLELEQIRLVSTATTNAIAVKTAPNKSTGGEVKSKAPTGGAKITNPINQNAARDTNTPSNNGG